MPNSINTSLRGTLSIHNFKCALLPRTPNSLHLHHLKNPSKDSKPHPTLITTSSSSSTPSMSMIIRPPPPPFIIDTPKEQPQHDDDNDDDESLEELMKRVERVKEMMKGGEYVHKFLMRNVVGEEEEEVVVMRGHVEVMVGDVVERFWEKPVEYLRSGGGRLEDRVKDLRRIVGIFEQACLDHGKEVGSSKRGKQCPFLQSFVHHN